MASTTTQTSSYSSMESSNPSICVECGETVTSLYKEYSKDNIRLTRCQQCGSVADKYIEYELILVILDIALHKIQAYRHLLFNRHPHCDLQWVALMRIGMALVILDTHIRYAIYVYTTSSQGGHSDVSTENTEYQLQLIFRIFIVSILEHLVHVATVLLVIYLVGGLSDSLSESQSREEQMINNSGYREQNQPIQRGKPPPGATAKKMVQCLLYPNFGRLVVVFVMIWEQHIIVSNIISFLVFTSQWQALQAVMGRSISSTSSSSAAQLSKQPTTAFSSSSPPSPRAASLECTLLGLAFLIGLIGMFSVRLLAFQLDPSCTDLYLI